MLTKKSFNPYINKCLKGKSNTILLESVVKINKFFHTILSDRFNFSNFNFSQLNTVLVYLSSCTKSFFLFQGFNVCFRWFTVSHTLSECRAAAAAAANRHVVLDVTSVRSVKRYRCQSGPCCDWSRLSSSVSSFSSSDWPLGRWHKSFPARAENCIVSCLVNCSSRV